MEPLLELLTAFGPYAKEPPKRSMLTMRLINQLIDSDLLIKRGSDTLANELGREGAPPPTAVGHSAEFSLREGLASEKEKLGRRSIEVQLLLAISDLSQRISVVPTFSEGAAELRLGATSTTFTAPDPTDLKEAVRDLLKFMQKRPLCLDEVVFESNGLDLAFPLVCPVAKFHTLLAMDVVTNVVSVPLHMIKHMLDVKRPNEIDSRVKPVIPVPGHASYPGGHAATTYALATVLAEITGASEEQKERFECIARRISRNREKVGLHTRLDTEEGKRLGRLIANWMIQVAKNDGQAWGVIFSDAKKEWGYKPAKQLAPLPSAGDHLQNFQADAASPYIATDLQVLHDAADHLTRTTDLGGDVSVSQTDGHNVPSGGVDD